MVKISCFFILFFIAVTVQAQHDDHNNKPTQSNVIIEDVLRFKESVHDFGQIPQGKPVFYNFEIVNTGKASLKLDNVQFEPEFGPAAGASSTIRVGYNAAATNYFEKYITITYNNNQTKQITIKGTVWKAPDGSAPANASIDLLKKQTF